MEEKKSPWEEDVYSFPNKKEFDSILDVEDID